MVELIEQGINATEEVFELSYCSLCVPILDTLESFGVAGLG